MGASYEVWLDDDRGRRLALLDGLSSLEVVKTVNAAGYFQIVIGGLAEGMLARDRMIEVWRKPQGGNLELYFAGFLRRWRLNGFGWATISGPGVTELLGRRIVAYAAGSSQADKTDQADDMMKAVVRENFTASATDGDRSLAGVGFSVAGDTGGGPSIRKGFAWKNCLDVLQDIAETAALAGTDVFFEVRPTFPGDGTIGLLFDTAINQPGVDRTVGAGGADVALFGLEYGNLDEIELDYDASDEVTVGYGGGQGEGDNRTTAEVEDTSRSGLSVWQRREAFGDARNEQASAGVTAKSQEIVQAGRPKLRFKGRLLSTDQTRYGLDWNFGDRVSAQYRGMNFDGLVRQVTLTMNEQGEAIRASLEVENG